MRRVTVIGAGRTGRGMIGEQFFTEGGFDLVLADCDAALVEALRAQGRYTVEQTDLLSGTARTTLVEGFEAVDTVREHEAYLDALATSEMVVTAVFPDAFEQVARDLAEMVARRRARGVVQPVAVILGGNFVGLKARFSELIGAALPDGDRAFFESHVALVTSKANRKVVFADPTGRDRLALSADDKPLLPVDDAFPFGDDWVRPSFFQLEESCERSMIEKIWSENLLHCSLGFMGACRGFQTVRQAVEDDRVRTLAWYAWREGRRALEAEYGMPMPTETDARVMFDKFASPFFSDRIARVTRQPARKLRRNDRFMGPALLCLKHGITPYFITRAAAHGFCYVDEDEPQSREIADTVARLGVEGGVARVCELDPACPADRAVLDLLTGAVRELDAGRTLIYDMT